MTSSRFSYAQNALRSTTIPSTVSPWLLQSHHSQIIINILPTSSNLMIRWTLTDARSNYTLSTVYNNHYHRYRITHLLSVITSHPTATQRLFWDDTLWRSGVAGKVQGQVTYGELYRAYKSRLYNCIKRTIHLWSESHEIRATQCTNSVESERFDDVLYVSIYSTSALYNRLNSTACEWLGYIHLTNNCSCYVHIITHEFSQSLSFLVIFFLFFTLGRNAVD